jgi:hypothetical protein
MNILKENISWPASSYDGKETSDLINDAVSHNLRILCQEIVKTIPGLLSIYLTGSYAASEGTVLVEENNIKLISDYDLLIITKKKVALNNIRGKSFPNLKNTYSMPGHPLFEVFIWTLRDLKKLPPTKFLYDFRSAKCIFGTDLRAMIPEILPSAIPPNEGIRLIFNRAFGVLIPFDPSFLNEEFGIKRHRHLAFETAKLILGVIDAMMIIQGTYLSVTNKDLKKFREDLSCQLPQLNEMRPKVDQLIERALEYRLKPSIAIEEEALDLWFNSRSLLLMGLNDSFKRLYGIEEPSLEETINSFVNENPQSFILNGVFGFNLLKKQKQLHLKTIYKKPSNAILGVSLFLIFSVDRTGRFDKNLLNAARGLLANHIGIKIDEGDPLKVWRVLKQYAYQNYFDVFSPASFPLSKRLIH